MATSSDMNPLCVTPLLKEIYHRGKNLDVGAKGQTIKDGLKGTLRLGLGVNPDQLTVVGIYHLLENLKEAFCIGKDGSVAIIPGFEKRLTSLEEAHRRSYLDLSSGAAPEFNDLIGRIVEQKVRERLEEVFPEGAGEVSKGPKVGPEEKVARAMVEIDQQIVELSQLLLPAATSGPMRTLREVLQMSEEAQVVMRNPDIETREKSRRLSEWLNYLSDKQAERLQQGPIAGNKIWEGIDKIRGAANALIYNLNKMY